MNDSFSEDLIRTSPAFAALAGVATHMDDTRKARTESKLLKLTRTTGNIGGLKDWQIKELIKARNKKILPNSIKAGLTTGGVLAGTGLTIKALEKMLKRK